MRVSYGTKPLRAAARRPALAAERCDGKERKASVSVEVAPFDSLPEIGPEGRLVKGGCGRRQMANPVLVEVLRGALVESRHAGAVAVMDADGATVLQLGDVERPVFPRSAV